MVAAGVSELKWCYGCSQSKRFTGHHCQSCMRSIEQVADSTRITDQVAKMTPEEWRAQQDQWQQEFETYMRRKEQLRERRRQRVWWRRLVRKLRG